MITGDLGSEWTLNYFGFSDYLCDKTAHVCGFMFLILLAELLQDYVFPKKFCSFLINNSLSKGFAI